MSFFLAMAGYLVVPGAILILRNSIDFEDPDNVFILRAVAAGVSALTGAVLVFFYVQIISSPKKNSVVYVRPSQLYSAEFQGLQDPSEPDEKKEMTFREYDLAKLKDLAIRLFMTTSMTFLIHWAFEATPVLVAALFVQPRLIMNTPLFRIYIRGQDEKIFRELKRPWPEPKPGMAMRWQKQYLDYVRSLDVDADQAAGNGQSQAQKKAGSGKKGKKRIKAQ